MYESRNQLQEENLKTHKYVEIKQHATDSQRTNQRKLKSTEKSENRNIVYQNLRYMAGVLRGKF